MTAMARTPEAERKALERALADYATLRKDLRARRKAQQASTGRPATLPVLPVLDLVAVHCTSESLPLDEDAFDLVVDAIDTESLTGWCRFRSEIGWSGRLPAGYASAGPPITAEWVEPGAVSCRLLPDPDGAPGMGRLWTLSERLLKPEDPLQDGEIACLRERRLVLSEGLPDPCRHLVYHVFWGADPDDDAHALRRRFDRLAGFSGRSKST